MGKSSKRRGFPSWWPQSRHRKHDCSRKVHDGKRQRSKTERESVGCHYGQQENGLIENNGSPYARGNTTAAPDPGSTTACQTKKISIAHGSRIEVLTEKINRFRFSGLLLD
ncbi:hypothetical protein Ddc_05997 [Ditylenchus destructor]|nr:hypothetical protein Ddc_05997 [Ditylenchus destructor]